MRFIKFTLIWVSQNLAIPFWVVGHIHLSIHSFHDLVAIPPNCEVLFSEVKTPRGRVSALQKYRLKELKEYGYNTEIYRG